MSVNKRSKGRVGEKLRGLAAYITKMNIPVYASHASFFITLAVFPMLLLLVSALRYTGLSVDSLTEILDGVIPAALIPFIKRLIQNAYQSTSGTLLSLSALMALWSSSRGIYGLHKGLNSIYEVSENRGWLYTRAMSVVYTVVFLAVLLLTLVLHVFGSTILQVIPFDTGSVWTFLDSIVDLRFFLLLIVQTVVFTAMYMALPNKHNKLLDSFPGAVFSSLGWLILSDLYSRYVENFSNYANIYGSIYAVALSMLWLYCCVSIIFYGGALNVYLMEEKKN